MLREREKKTHWHILGCNFCQFFYTHHQLRSERRNGVILKPGKIYCLFAQKPVKMDSRKRHNEIPADCPRHNTAVRFAVYTLKKRVSTVNFDAVNAIRYWRVYSENLTMITHDHLFGEGRYTAPDCEDGFLWDCGAHVHKLQQDDVVVREDGFTIRAWRWNGKYLVLVTDFDEMGIKKMPKRRNNDYEQL